MAFAGTWTSFGPGGLNIKAAQKTELEVKAYYDDPPQKQYGSVSSLAVYKDALYAGGLFDNAGGVSVSNIAKWDGKKWSPLGKGLGGPVKQILVYKEEMYVIGNFDTAGGKSSKSIAVWDGKDWKALAGVNTGELASMTVFKDELVVAGLIGEIGDIKDAHNIAKWDGKKWSTLGQGLPNDPYTMTVFKDELYVGGGFIEAGDNKDNLFKWDGKSWKGVGSFGGAVSTLAATDKLLFASGHFTRMKNKPMGGVVQYDGKKWSTVGTGLVHPAPRQKGFVATLKHHNGILLAGGEIPNLKEDNEIVSGAQWDGKKWTPNADGISGEIYSFIEFNGDLYSAGRFMTTDSITVENFQYFNVAKLKK